MKYLAGVSSIILLVLGGCDVQSGPIQTPGYAATGADYRLVLSKTRDEVDTRPDAFSGIAGNTAPAKELKHDVICAEPSPDAIKAIAESVTASLKAGGTNPASGELAQSLGTSVGYIGMRTVMVQAVRDLAFQACSAYQNGALSYMDYERIMRGSPQIILGIEAIDALAGPQPAPSLVVNGPVSGGTTGGSDSTGSGQQKSASSGGSGTNVSVTLTPPSATSQPSTGGTTPAKTDASSANASTQQNTINQTGRAAPTDGVVQAVVNVLCLSLFDQRDLLDPTHLNSPWAKVCLPPPATPAKTTSNPPAPGGTVAKSDPALAAAQGILKEAGLYDGPLDGLAGPLTVQALKAYQAEKKIPTTGTLDDVTKGKMKLT